jgi:hypothetical protein
VHPRQQQVIAPVVEVRHSNSRKEGSENGSAAKFKNGRAVSVVAILIKSPTNRIAAWTELGTPRTKCMGIPDGYTSACQRWQSSRRIPIDGQSDPLLKSDGVFSRALLLQQREDTERCSRVGCIERISDPNRAE